MTNDNGKMKRFYLWGDSIGKGVIFSRERNRYCLAPERCERRLQEAGVALESHARMGATIGQGYADFAASRTEPGSVAVIEFGGNDCDLDWSEVAKNPEIFHDGRTPLAEFQQMLRLFARDARARGMRPVMVLPPPLPSQRYFRWISRGRDAEAVMRYLGDVEHIGRWHDSYVETIRAVAEETGSGLLDLHTPFVKARDFLSLICEDGIHPSAAGQELMARVALSRLAAA